MKIKFKILLKCYHRGTNFYILTTQKKYAIKQDCEININVESDYASQNHIEIFSVNGIDEGSGQEIKIISIDRNGNFFRNWQKFCAYRVQKDSGVKDKIISNCCQLQSNGTLFLNVAPYRRTFEFFPYYRSQNREDFVFYNRHLDNSNNCEWAAPPKIHTYRNQPYLPQYRNQKEYDFGCFGCSVTRGVDLKRGDEWPALLEEHGSVINLAERGLGADGIFLNIRSCLREFSIKKVVVLWPNLERKCLRWQLDSWHVRMPISIHSTDRLSNGELLQWIWVTAEQASAMKSSFIERCVSGHQARLSKKIIIKTIKQLSSRGITALHSSWSIDTYNFLKTLELGSSLLQFFPGNADGHFYGPSDRHPTASVHRRWLEQNIKSITK